MARREELSDEQWSLRESEFAEESNREKHRKMSDASCGLLFITDCFRHQPVNQDWQ